MLLSIEGFVLLGTLPLTGLFVPLAIATLAARSLCNLAAFDVRQESPQPALDVLAAVQYGQGLQTLLDLVRHAVAVGILRPALQDIDEIVDTVPVQVWMLARDLVEEMGFDRPGHEDLLHRVPVLGVGVNDRRRDVERGGRKQIEIDAGRRAQVDVGGLAAIIGSAGICYGAFPVLLLYDVAALPEHRNGHRLGLFGQDHRATLRGQAGCLRRSSTERL